MDRLMEKSNMDKLAILIKLITSQTQNILSFCRRASKVTYFKLSFSYEIKTYNSGSILYDKTWEEGDRNE